MTKNRAVFLDRDGVLNAVTVVNGVPNPPHSVSEVIIPEDALQSLQRLKSVGYQLIVVTNQPDVVRGKTKKETVEAINDYLKNKLPIDAIYVCYHDNFDDCDCRKPKPGLITHAAKTHQLDLSQSFMIGDRWKDIAAGNNAKCKTIFLDASYGESIDRTVVADYIVTSLNAATNCILNERRSYNEKTC